MTTPIEQLADAEKRINKAAESVDATWRWAPYAKPVFGPPFMWNDIILTYSNGDVERMEAIEFCQGFGL